MNAARRYASFTAFALITVLVTLALARMLHPAPALLAGFDCGVIVFLTLIARRYGAASPDTMRARAADNEPDHHTLIAIALLVVGVIITAVWIELSSSSGRDPAGIILAAVTLVLAWLFANTLFALHYAHVWYLPATKDGQQGLAFPGGDPATGDASPDFWDFTYFAFVLGMTFQVSDVVITAKRMRRLALVHAMLAFVFNIAVIALSVSLVAAALAR